MENKIVLGIAALSLIMILGFSMVSAFSGMGPMGPNADKETMRENSDAMRTAIEDNDYEAWKTLMEAQIAQMQASITEENFNAIAQRHSEIGGQNEQMRVQRDAFKAEIEELKASDNFSKEAVQELQVKYNITGAGNGFGNANGRMGEKHSGIQGMNSESCPYN